jgi:hypothetical protein
MGYELLSILRAAYFDFSVSYFAAGASPPLTCHDFNPYISGKSSGIGNLEQAFMIDFLKLGQYSIFYCGKPFRRLTLRSQNALFAPVKMIVSS